MQNWRDRLQSLATTTTFDYDYMKRGKKAPDRMPKLLATHGEALDALGVEDDQVILAGKSMGSRVCCHLALQRAVAGVICFGYPLVGRSNVRDQVLLDLERPILFIQGTKDTLCPLDQLDQVRQKMRAKNELHVVDGGNHSLLVGKRQLKAEGRTQDDVDDDIDEAIAEFLESL